MSQEDRELIIAALATYAASERRRAPQPKHPQAEEAYRRIMGRAVAADRLREQLEAS